MAAKSLPLLFAVLLIFFLSATVWARDLAEKTEYGTTLPKPQKEVINANGFQDEKQYLLGHGPAPGHCTHRCGYRCCTAEEYATFSAGTVQKKDPNANGLHDEKIIGPRPCC